MATRSKSKLAVARSLSRGLRRSRSRAAARGRARAAHHQSGSLARGRSRVLTVARDQRGYRRPTTLPGARGASQSARGIAGLLAGRRSAAARATGGEAALSLWWRIVGEFFALLWASTGPRALTRADAEICALLLTQRCRANPRTT